MTDNDHRERRRKQANAIRIRMSPVRMSREEFTKHYREPHVLTHENIRNEVERITQELFCDECIVPEAHGAILAHVLHSTIEEDPLRNYWKLCTLRCFNCGFEEIVPLDAPVFDPKELHMGVDMALKPGMIHAVTKTATEVKIMSDHYEREFHRQMEEYQRKQAVQVQAQKLQTMKQFYQQTAIGPADLQRALSREMNINLSNAMKQMPPQLGGAGFANTAFDGYSLSNPPKDPEERESWMKRLAEFVRRS